MLFTLKRNEKYVTGMLKIERTYILLLFLALLMLLSFFISSNTAAAPSLSYLDPTPDDGHYQTERNVTINVSITEENLEELNYNWNGTNYTIYDDSLILMYNFDNIADLGETDTQIIDISGNGNTGTAQLGASPTTNGKYDGAFDFDGYGDAVTTNIDLNSYSSFTIMGWVYPRATGEDVSRTGFFGQNDAFETLWDGSTLNYWTETGDCNIEVAANEWVHITLQYQSSTISIYKNGALANSVSGEGGSSSYTFNIGGGGIADPDEGNGLDGIIDEIRIWNTVLTEKEVYQQYISNLQKYNSTQWYLSVNQSKNATTDLDDGIYTYQAFATDTSNNQAQTEKRTIGINMDPSPPVPETSTIILIALGTILLIGVIRFKGRKKT